MRKLYLAGPMSRESFCRDLLAAWGETHRRQLAELTERMVQALDLGDDTDEAEARERLGGCDCNGEDGSLHLLGHLIAERDELRARLDAVLALHEINPCDHGSEPHAPILFAFGETCYGPWCRGCGARYPCRTRRAAEGVE